MHTTRAQLKEQARSMLPGIRFALAGLTATFAFFNLTLSSLLDLFVFARSVFRRQYRRLWLFAEACQQRTGKYGILLSARRPSKNIPCSVPAASIVYE